MDGVRFDNLTRRLAQGHTRRRLLRGLAGGVTAAIGVDRLGHQAADAVICRQDRVLCAQDAQCCSGSCENHHCGASTPCGSCPQIAAPNGACFWQDCFNYGGACCWDLNGFHTNNPADCAALDRCNGGGCTSGGGCYKWATTSC